jgi:hypothetical protein
VCGIGAGGSCRRDNHRAARGTGTIRQELPSGEDRSLPFVGTYRRIDLPETFTYFATSRDLDEHRADEIAHFPSTSRAAT